MSVVRVADHAPAPGGRFVKDGPFSGEWFRENILTPALLDAIAHQEPLTVELDGVAGYGSSFLEEAFGGLVRRGIVARADLQRYLSVVAKSKAYEPFQGLVGRYMRDAQRTPAAA